jgi:hypothetical protein
MWNLGVFRVERKWEKKMEMGVMGRPAVARRWCIEDVVVIGGGGLRWNDGWVLGCDGDERKMGGGGGLYSRR